MRDDAGEAAGAGPDGVILLGLHNGACWLAEQLDSFAAQQGVRWRLLASDDGSTDGTCDIVRAFAQAQPAAQVTLIDGLQRGPGQNFLHLLRQTPADAGFVALSDQDDVWLPGKLARALAMLGGADDGVPSLYCGRTIICDRTLRQVGLSPLFVRPPSFRNALTQSIGGGNTMVLNRAGLALARAAAAEAGPIVMHDWWLYQLVSGAGGRVIYDAEPQVLYRQHGGNQVGANASLAARARRMRMLARGVLRDWNDINIAALRASGHRLTPENLALLEAFAAARALPLRQRLPALRALGLYRQTRAGEMSYFWAAAAGLV